LDLQSFLSGGSLADNVKIFADKESADIEKGVFPYEVLTKDNLTEILLKEEPFEKNDFWSDLTNSSISDEIYKDYLEESKNFKNRLEYLLHYNKKDTSIMVPIIQNLQ
jgi:hypothetical protein